MRGGEPKEPIGKGEVFWSDNGKQIRIFGETTSLRGPTAVLERVAMRVLHLVDGHGGYAAEADTECKRCEAVRRARRRAQGDFTLSSRLADAFAKYEVLGFKVGKVWLSQEHIDMLEGTYGWDPVHQRAVLETGMRGLLWGAKVFVSTELPPQHVAILPDGFEGTLVDGAGSMPL